MLYPDQEIGGERHLERLERGAVTMAIQVPGPVMPHKLALLREAMERYAWEMNRIMEA